MPGLNGVSSNGPETIGVQRANLCIADTQSVANSNWAALWIGVPITANGQFTGIAFKLVRDRNTVTQSGKLTLVQ